MSEALNIPTPQEATAELLDVLREFIGDDLLSYEDRERTAAFARRILKTTHLAIQNGDTEALEQVPNLLRFVAASYGVVVARGKERLLAQRFQLVVTLIMRGAKLLL